MAELEQPRPVGLHKVQALSPALYRARGNFVEMLKITAVASPTHLLRNQAWPGGTHGSRGSGPGLESLLEALEVPAALTFSLSVTRRGG